MQKGGLNERIKRIFAINAWDKDSDTLLFIGFICFVTTFVFDIIGFVTVSLVLEYRITLAPTQMSRAQAFLFWYFVLHTIICSLLLTTTIYSLYTKIISAPVHDFKRRMQYMSRAEMSDYLYEGRLSRPFKDPNSKKTWEDQVLDYIDASTSEKYIDELTGCFNKTYLYRKFVGVMNTQRLSNISKNGPMTYNSEIYSIMMIDIDHFKKINDDFGHATGDEVLIKVGKVLRECVGNKGIVIRNGGEEFLVFCAARYPYSFSEVAKRINRTFREQVYAKSPMDGSIRNITCSVGFLNYPFVEGPDYELSLQDHIDLADMAMYMAKTHGRDRYYELKLKNEPTGKFDIVKFCSDPVYGLKRKFYYFESESSPKQDITDPSQLVSFGVTEGAAAPKPKKAKAAPSKDDKPSDASDADTVKDLPAEQKDDGKPEGTEIKDEKQESSDRAPNKAEPSKNAPKSSKNPKPSNRSAKSAFKNARAKKAAEGTSAGDAKKKTAADDKTA